MSHCCYSKHSAWHQPSYHVQQTNAQALRPPTLAGGEGRLLRNRSSLQDTMQSLKITFLRIFIVKLLLGKCYFQRKRNIKVSPTVKFCLVLVATKKTGHMLSHHRKMWMT